MEKIDQESKYKAPSLGEGDAPWLVFTHGKSKKKRVQTFCTIPPNSNVYVKSIPELRGKRIRASFHGWLLLRDYDNHNMYSLWDPITSQLIILPPLPPRANDNDDEDEDEDVYETCALTSPPTCDTCVLFLFFNDQVFFCRPSTSTSTITWTSHRLELDGHKVLRIEDHVTLNGIIHSWTYVEHSEGGLDINLTTIEIVDNSLSLKSLVIVPPDCDYICIHSSEYLVESCGCIYCVSVDKQHANDDKITIVKVWELNLLERNWVEVHSLDGRAFFLGFDCCTWCWGSIVEGECIQGDCVYLVIDKHIIFCYSLRERSSTLLSPDQDLLIDPLKTGIWVNPVMPQHKRLSIIQKGTQWSMVNKNTIVKDDVSDHEMISSNTISEIKQLPQDDEAHGEESPLIKLPEDMMHLISKYIHMLDYCNFRASCTILRSALPPVQWRTSNSLPLLIFFKNDHGLCQVMDPSQDNSPYISLRPSLDLFTVDFSKDGWLILHTRYEGYSLKFFNPFTKEIINFPSPSPCFLDLRGIGFSTYPTSPDCVTVAFDYSKVGIEIYCFQSGDETWRSCDFPGKFITGTSSPVYFEGTFYVLDISGKLGAFKLVDEEEKWRVYGNEPLGNSLYDPYSYHLLECDGELVAVFIGYMGECVDVFKFNFCKEKWVKVKSLGNYSFFVGKSSFSVQITEVGMRNRIYISRIKGSSMIYYSLETGKFHASKSQDLIPDFCKTTWHMDNFWL